MIQFTTRRRMAALLMVAMAGSLADAGEPDGAELFESRVRPVLVERCVRCHGAAKQSSGLRLDSRAALLEGGLNGPVVVPGKPEESLLVQAVRHEGDIQMPPKGKLPEPAIEALTTWVRMGAAWPETAVLSAAAQREASPKHWAFQPPKLVTPPTVRNAYGVANPIDAFVLARLEARGMTPSPRADRRTLLRRVTYDLTGLPPTDAEVRAFEADPSTDAFARVVDRLLASPAYGERWGRHWLDVARYADTKGYVFQEERRYPFSYTYRDYVIRAFNEDLPYNTFILQQLAADQLPKGDDTRALAAMGFLTVGRRFLNDQNDIIDDRIDVVSRGLLGLTVACARCHDHKYDPIPTEDYYSLHGVFASSVEPTELPELKPAPPSPKAADYRAQLAARQKEIDDYQTSRRAEIEADLRNQAANYLLGALELEFRSNHPKLDEVARARKLSPQRLRWFAGRWARILERTRAGHDPVLGPWHALASAPAHEVRSRAVELAIRIDPAKPIDPLVARALTDRPPGTWREVVERYGDLFRQAATAAPDAAGEGEAVRQFVAAADGPFTVPSSELRRVLNRAEREKLTALRRKVDELNVTHPGSPPRAMVLEDAPRPTDPHVFLRGRPERPGKSVPRQFLKVLAGPDRSPFSHGSGRLDLAQAIARADNPLTARVMVNRIWMHHFGAGLVTTPSDFGLRSEPPSHPELLDWLAVRFVEQGWSVKAVHRLILLSNTYQQRSDERPEYRATDPLNRLLWKQNRQRLDFEAVRDSLLAVAGRLDPTMGGRPVSITATPFSTRRTVYAFIDRQNLDGVFRTFDFATPDASSPMRYRTTVPQQALFLLNSPFVAEQAHHLAQRSEREAGSDPEDRIELLYRWVFGRAPEPRERELGTRFLADREGHGARTPWDVYAQVLLLTNEFMYVD